MKNNNRRGFFAKIGIGLASITLSSFPNVVAMAKKIFSKIFRSKIFFTTGYKTAEVSAQSALLWTRLCAKRKPRRIRHKRNETVFRYPIGFDEDLPVDQMDGVGKGMSGSVKVN
ncbi:hypothetical protein U3A58_20830 [Algoriphagus sp. C2-6-M1]|uniref:hypothetical protein n=1 Tax=Algoriphagus persicinus TaxID=3108754 RepID=UPI002B3D5854|nr:hypothetical protein [Algoriphagus sp. C2-6-M1]MEB2782839.1 hypothetical protein [Algoriphagus sp. C2-6-M1]